MHDTLIVNDFEYASYLPSFYFWRLYIISFSC